MPLLKIEHLSYSYENADGKGISREVIRDLSFTVERGEYVAMLGHNGSGKSTLAKLCMMILEPTKGKIIVNGTDMTDPDLTDAQILDFRKKIGMVFQNPDNQMVATMADEEVAFGPENLGLPSKEIRERVEQALAAVGMSEYAGKEPSRLSGGQKQRIAIAGILAMHPDCIIFDESTSMLDPQGRSDVMEIIDKLNKEGVTIIHITHDMNEAARARRVIILNDGQIVRDGTPDEIFSDPESLEPYSLRVPQCTLVAWQLKKAGLPVSGSLSTPVGCRDAILNCFGFASGEAENG